jgi:hypothetical protein
VYSLDGLLMLCADGPGRIETTVACVVWKQNAGSRDNIEHFHLTHQLL